MSTLLETRRSDVGEEETVQNMSSFHKERFQVGVETPPIYGNIFLNDVGLNSRNAMFLFDTFDTRQEG